MNARSIVGALSLVLAAGLFVAGCSSLPTSPASSPSGTVQPGDGSESSGLVGELLSRPRASRPASSSVYIRALRGGTVSAGNFTVVIPPLALKADAIVTVRQEDPTKPEVDLSITPEDRNGFRLPVLLVADVRPMDSKLVSLSYLSWWNPETEAWERCPESSVSVLNLTVQAPLMHFSKYRVEQGGKAGW